MMMSKLLLIIMLHNCQIHFAYSFYTITRSQGLFSLVDASLLLYRRQSAILKSSEHHVTVFKASIALLLFALSRLNALCPDDEKSHKDKKMKEAFEKLKTTLWEWIANHGVIGGSLFGGTISHWKGDLELQVSNIYLTKFLQRNDY